MDAVFSDSPFVDFGADALFPFAATGLRHIEGDSPEQLRSAVRQYVPRVPGVYGMLDAVGRLIYVGKSKALRNRLLSYFLPFNEEDKAGRIVQSTCAIVWEYQPSDFAALLREQSLIRSFRPRYNVQGIPRRQQPIYICLGRPPAEQLYTARQHDSRAVSSIGPLFGATRAGRAVEVLNRIFRLRDCSSQQACGFSEQLQLFDIELRPGCIRLEIGSCLGPCISACSRTAYASQVSGAQAFLEGSDDTPLLELEKAMRQAAAQQHYEQAATLREDVKAVAWLSRRASDMALARENYTFVYPVACSAQEEQSTGGAGRQRREVWYLIRRGIIEGAVAAPTTQTAQVRTHQLLQQWLASDRCVGTRFVPRPETLALVASWFRNNRGELKRTFMPSAATARTRGARPKKNKLAS